MLIETEDGCKRSEELFLDRLVSSAAVLLIVLVELVVAGCVLVVVEVDVVVALSGPIVVEEELIGKLAVEVARIVLPPWCFELTGRAVVVDLAGLLAIVRIWAEVNRALDVLVLGRLVVVVVLPSLLRSSSLAVDAVTADGLKRILSVSPVILASKPAPSCCHGLASLLPG